MSEEQASPSESRQPQRATDPASDDANQARATIGGTDDQKRLQAAFPVVGVGASAGGLQAFKQLLQCLPSAPGMAIIFVQHLSPHHDSNLDEIFARETSLKVQEVRQQVRLEPNHLYVIPPDQDLAVFDGSLQLMERPQHPARHMPVDYLFRSLAEDIGPRAIGVILSGTGSDGVEGIKAIKAAGGVTLAQDQKSAGFAGMPEAAAATGQVDLVLPPAMLAQELCRIARHPHLAQSTRQLKQEGLTTDSEALAKIFFMLRRSKDVDFSQYKRSTVERRIARRMVLHKIDHIKRYLQFLQRNAAEVRALFDDMLITVTSFFRDPESFATLNEKIFPQIVRGRDRTTPIRIWVPACSTGEEAYSLTIALLEYMAEHDLSQTMQVFATDVSDAAVSKARHGHYPENIAGDLSEERLRRFFTKTEHGYQVSKAVRDVCVFARQNVTKEPPFSHLDLLSCRNLLIYLGPALQRRVIPTFHYALRPNGFLMLGRSETIGGFSDLFSLVDREQKIYVKKATATRLPAGLEPSQAPRSVAATEGAASEATSEAAGGVDLERQADALVLSEYGPPGVIINQELEILHFRGSVAAFIAPSPGTASLNLMQMICPELKLEIRAMIHQVRREHQPVRKPGLRCTLRGATVDVDLEVHPLGAVDSDHPHFLVLFRQHARGVPSDGAAASGTADSENHDARPGAADPREAEIDRLREELRQMKAALQDVVEDQDATNEELRAANEEIQSSNEELQSTNEELETAKEELQSSNEELMTLNAELEHQCAAATRAIDDFNNLHRSVGIPVILLDHELRIRRFTPPAAQHLGLRESDCGRRIGELRLGIQRQDGLEAKIRGVFNSLNTLIEEVRAENGHWYSLQVRPYRTAEDRITGAVVVLIDITEHHHTRNQRVLAENIVQTVRQPMILLDADLRVIKANRAFYSTFAVTPGETEQHPLNRLGDGQWDSPQLRRLLMDIIPGNEHFQDFEIVHDFPGVGRKRVLLDASRIDNQEGQPHLILLCMPAVTDA